MNPWADCSRVFMVSIGKNNKSVAVPAAAPAWCLVNSLVSCILREEPYQKGLCKCWLGGHYKPGVICYSHVPSHTDSFINNTNFNTKLPITLPGGIGTFLHTTLEISFESFFQMCRSRYSIWMLSDDIPTNVLGNFLGPVGGVVMRQTTIHIEHLIKPFMCVSSSRCIYKRRLKEQIIELWAFAPLRSDFWTFYWLLCAMLFWTGFLKSFLLSAIWSFTLTQQATLNPQQMAQHLENGKPILG